MLFVTLTGRSKNEHPVKLIGDYTGRLVASASMRSPGAFFPHDLETSVIFFCEIKFYLRSLLQYCFTEDNHRLHLHLTVVL